jgi:hypothetical protein
MPRLKENGVRAQSSGCAQRHGRLNPEFSRLIARCRNYSALIRLPADDNRLAAQLRPIEEFDRDEKRVHVDVEDGGW